MSHSYRPNLTPKRRAWLEALEKRPQARRGIGPTGCACMRLGWTEWCDHPATGKPLGAERLTDAGRAVLAAAKSST